MADMFHSGRNFIRRHLTVILFVTFVVAVFSFGFHRGHEAGKLNLRQIEKRFSENASGIRSIE